MQPANSGTPSSTWEQSTNYGGLDAGCDGKRVCVYRGVLGGFGRLVPLYLLSVCSLSAAVSLPVSAGQKKPRFVDMAEISCRKPGGYRRFGCQLSAESRCWLKLSPPRANTPLTPAVGNRAPSAVGAPPRRRVQAGARVGVWGHLDPSRRLDAKSI